MLGLSCQPYHSLAVIFWISEFTDVDISFLICKMGVIVPPFIGLLGGSKNNACDTEKHFPDVSCGLSGVVPQHLWNNRKGDPFLKRGSLCLVPVCPSPDLPCHRTELWMNIYCTRSQQGHPVIRLTTPISLSFLWTVPSSSFKLRPHFISEMKFDFLLLESWQKAQASGSPSCMIYTQGLCKIMLRTPPRPSEARDSGCSPGMGTFHSFLDDSRMQPGLWLSSDGSFWNFSAENLWFRHQALRDH